MKLVKVYFTSWWIPTGVSLVLLLIAGSLDFSGPYRYASWAAGFGIAFVISLLGVLVSALINFLRACWLRGFLNLLGLLVAFFAMLLVAFVSMFGPSEDGFADDLVIPSDLEITVPLDEVVPGKNTGADEFQSALLEALNVEGEDNSDVTGNAQSLSKLARIDQKLLRRYLASSAAWRVYDDKGKQFATRRWKFGDQWAWGLNGYYLLRDWKGAGDAGSNPEMFQFRLTIGLDGKPWFENASTSHIEAGKTFPVGIRRENALASHCVIETDPLAVEIYEERGGNERRLTKAALVELEKEFAPLAENPTWETARSRLGKESIVEGEPTIELRDGAQGGIYDVTIRANPGEPGRIYLKAFEVTKGTPLSATRLKQDSMEYIGWSDNPREQFLSNSQIMIKEGDWGKYYAARFEVWFVPKNGTSERKLFERNFKIEGWQR